MRVETDGEVAEPVVVAVDKEDAWEPVPGLDGEASAEPDELERQVMMAEFEPILCLPIEKAQNRAWEVMGSWGRIGWGVFGTVRFADDDRSSRRWRSEVDDVRERLENVLILFGIVNDRVKDRRKHAVLRHLRLGQIKLEHIVDADLRSLGRLLLRAMELRRQLRALAKRRRSRRPQAAWE